MTGRTDMAFETHQSLLSKGKKCRGIQSEEYEREDMTVSRIRVCSPEGAEAMGKPEGTYITLSANRGWQADNDGVLRAAHVFASLLQPLLPPSGTVMVVGLGNTRITPDSIGPAAVDRVIVTRHLIDTMPDMFSGMRPVCAVKTGVLGCTGLETAETIKGICSRVRPAAVIAIDALASLSVHRLGCTFQMSDTGIVPGSGACNARRALDKNTLGVPVIALGVPTVVDADTIVADALKGMGEGVRQPDFPDFLVTPKDIDALVEKGAKVLGYAINLALQGDMSVADMEQFLC